MSKQPEALRLADTTTSLRGWKWADDVEAELRRQHALIEELREALAAYVVITNELTVGECYTNAGQGLIDASPRTAAALAKAEAQQ